MSEEVSVTLDDLNIESVDSEQENTVANEHVDVTEQESLNDAHDAAYVESIVAQTDEAAQENARQLEQSAS